MTSERATRSANLFSAVGSLIERLCASKPEASSSNSLVKSPRSTTSVPESSSASSGFASRTSPETWARKPSMTSRGTSAAIAVKFSRGRVGSDQSNVPSPRRLPLPALASTFVRAMVEPDSSKRALASVTEKAGRARRKRPSLRSPSPSRESVTPSYSTRAATSAVPPTRRPCFASAGFRIARSRCPVPLEEKDISSSKRNESRLIASLLPFPSRPSSGIRSVPSAKVQGAG